MASWTSLGHAMRRRMGAPSSHLEAAGKSMGRTTPTSDEVISSAAHAKSPRKSVGTAFDNVSGSPEKGTLVAKKNTQASDPTAGGKANKKNVLVNNAAASERMGAMFSVGVKMPAGTEPAAGPTMRNARTVPAAGGFQDGIQSSY